MSSEHQLLRAVVALSVLPIALGLTFTCDAVANAAPPTASLNSTLAKICPNARDAEKKAQEAHALTEPSQYHLYHETARLYYECAQSERNPHYRDVLTWIYASVVPDSWGTTDDARNGCPTIEVTLKDLIHRTTYADVKGWARNTLTSLDEHVCSLFK